MTWTSIAVSVAAPLAVLGIATAPAYADELDPPPSPAVETGDPFLDDLVGMVSEGPEPAPPPN